MQGILVKAVNGTGAGGTLAANFLELLSSRGRMRVRRREFFLFLNNCVGVHDINPVLRRHGCSLGFLVPSDEVQYLRRVGGILGFLPLRVLKVDINVLH